MLAGILFLIGVAPIPPSLETLQPWLVKFWYVILALGGAAGIVGALWPRRKILAGMELERAAMMLLASGTCMYMIAMIATGGTKSIGAAGFMAAWAGSCLWRARQLHQDIKYFLRLSQREDDELGY